MVDAASWRLSSPAARAARAAERGDQAAHPRRPPLPQRRKLPAPGPGARGRDARELARGASLPQHGRPEGAQEGGPAHGGLTPNQPALWTTLRVAHKAHHRNHDPICRRFWTQLLRRILKRPSGGYSRRHSRNPARLADSSVNASPRRGLQTGPSRSAMPNRSRSPVHSTLRRLAPIPCEASSLVQSLQTET
jgi:hypothetical protein